MARPSPVRRARRGRRAWRQVTKREAENFMPNRVPRRPVAKTRFFSSDAMSDPSAPQWGPCLAELELERIPGEIIDRCWQGEVDCARREAWRSRARGPILKAQGLRSLRGWA